MTRGIFILVVCILINKALTAPPPKVPTIPLWPKIVIAKPKCPSLPNWDKPSAIRELIDRKIKEKAIKDRGETKEGNTKTELDIPVNKTKEQPKKMTTFEAAVAKKMAKHEMIMSRINAAIENAKTTTEAPIFRRPPNMVAIFKPIEDSTIDNKENSDNLNATTPNLSLNNVTQETINDTERNVVDTQDIVIKLVDKENLLPLLNTSASQDKIPRFDDKPVILNNNNVQQFNSKIPHQISAKYIMLKPNQMNAAIPSAVTKPNPLVAKPKNANMNSMHQMPKMFIEQQLNTKSGKQEDKVVVLYKPEKLSLLEFYGEFLKQLTMTVLVPFHVSKLIS